MTSRPTRRAEPAGRPSFWVRWWAHRPGLWDGVVVIAFTTIATDWLGIGLLTALGTFTGGLAAMTLLATITDPASKPASRETGKPAGEGSGDA